jgi:hypothetical protein
MAQSETLTAVSQAICRRYDNIAASFGFDPMQSSGLWSSISHLHQPLPIPKSQRPAAGRSSFGKFHRDKIRRKHPRGVTSGEEAT